MKKYAFLIEIILSIIIDFLLFDLLSWYHFFDMPTPIVIIRFVIFLGAIFIFVKGIFNKIFKIENTNNQEK